MNTTGKFESTLSLEVTVHWSHETVYPQTYMQPAEGGTAVDRVTVKGPDGKEIDITHLISPFEMDELEQMAQCEAVSSGEPEWDDYEDR